MIEPIPVRAFLSRTGKIDRRIASLALFLILSITLFVPLFVNLTVTLYKTPVSNDVMLLHAMAKVIVSRHSSARGCIHAPCVGATAQAVMAVQTKTKREESQ